MNVNESGSDRAPGGKRNVGVAFSGEHRSDVAVGNFEKPEC